MVLKEGLEHVAFCMAVYQYQHRRGRLFLHEPPHGAWSWGLKVVQGVLQLDGVVFAIGDQCAFGHKINGEFVRKRTKWMTNCLEIAHAVAACAQEATHTCI